ncbi:cytochrome P450 [Desarmillaria tabescens]|uniref:Cytochrome P450 n=1 Tax=Armillaria tabescens TaxID=1929756 RepID=A0AA39NBC2_ARMTA|nr:cytochrome P450 [Desarmillaria tabescens]KAK0462485.1 cytochrome P450 [Desarmillaria tabescens]
MAFLIALSSLCLLSAAYFVFRRFTRISLASVPGPPSQSFLYGNLPELLKGQAGEIDFKWQAMYGDIVRIRAPLGEDRLLVSDPKALQYIYQTSGYRFIKPPGRKEIGRLITGPGILFAEGDDHRRHRKVLLPGFGGPEAKFYVPVFFTYASKMASKWKELISTSDNQSVVLDMPSWTSRAALDAIGEAAFDYQFGALDNSANPLTIAYTNLFFDTFAVQTDNSTLSLALMEWVPKWLVRFLVQRAPFERLRHARMTNELSVKANVSENPKTRLNDDELLAQMNTIILAGHETTANTLSWTFLELSKRPEVQERLRAEIREKERIVFDRGDTEFTVQDLDNMPYLTAIVKEVLRFHPIAYNTARVAPRDDVLPLSKPVTLTTGKVVQEVAVPRGTFIFASVAGYNRNKDIWGEDAHVFNPERWFRGSMNKEVPVGVYGNLFSFVGGLRSCIGWRFAVLELHAFLVEAINNFEFSMTTEAERIRREACTVMTPTVEGAVEKGAQLPLRVAIASRE